MIDKQKGFARLRKSFLFTTFCSCLCSPKAFSSGFNSFIDSNSYGENPAACAPGGGGGIRKLSPGDQTGDPAWRRLFDEKTPPWRGSKTYCKQIRTIEDKDCLQMLHKKIRTPLPGANF